jgi:CspA family cold shock protein
VNDVTNTKSYVTLKKPGFVNLQVIKFNKMNKGTVKFYNDAKGFGFIKDTVSSKEYFVHSTGVKESIRENDEVTFDLEEGKKGLNAVNVRLS